MRTSSNAICYETHIGLPPDAEKLCGLLAAIFTDTSSGVWLSNLTYRLRYQPFLSVLAVDDAQVVGCKLGYEYKPQQFYSWLGGIHPAYRGQGLAQALMQRQHDWCAQNGYRTIQTHTYNRWREMLLLNIRFGFDVIGTEATPKGTKILLEKTL